MEDLRFEDVAVNGVTLHLAEAGPADGRLVILLHGFPEYWGAWLEYIEVLAAAGYHVIAHDQRGYNLSCPQCEARIVLAPRPLNRIFGDVRAFECSSCGSMIIEYPFERNLRPNNRKAADAAE